MFESYKVIKMPINGRGVYSLWVADTDAKRSQGLKGVKKLPRKTGMIFVYREYVDHPFTMVGVYIPLTIMFLDADMSIVDIGKYLPGQKNIVSKRKYMYVVEI